MNGLNFLIHGCGFLDDGFQEMLHAEVSPVGGAEVFHHLSSGGTYCQSCLHTRLHHERVLWAHGTLGGKGTHQIKITGISYC